MRIARLRISAFGAAVRAFRASWRGNRAAPEEPAADSITLAAAGLAHDLNNLLTVITANSQLGSTERGDPAVRRRWLEVLEASLAAGELTQGLISVSRQTMLPLSAVSPNLVITNGLELLGRLAGDRMSIRTSLDEESGPMLINPTELLQVLMNLVLNARDAMPAEGMLTIETRAHSHSEMRDRGSGLRPGRYVVLTVADNGSGMDESTRGRAFEAFFSTKADSERTGLGLAIVSAIVRKSGGHVNVESAPGAGTRFELYFPEAGTVEPRQDMKSIRLSQLQSMTHETIEAAVTETGPGIYVLDRSSQGAFTVAYVGRADADLKAALHRHVGGYRFFKYAYCASAEAAFEAECDLFHEYHPIDNPDHPGNRSSWTCPHCGRSA